MDGFLDRVAFAVAGTDYRWADVLAAARHRRVWDDVEAEVRAGLAGQRWAAENPGVLPSAAEVRHAADTFRYARRLTAAEEMEAWLVRWSVTKEEWLSYIRRSLVRRRIETQLDAAVARFPPSDDDVAGTTWATGACSGALETFARDLAARVVAAQLARQPAAANADLSLRFDDLEAAFRAWTGELTTPAAVTKTIALHHLDWIRIDSQAAAFATAAAAREALMCVRHDGMELPAVAAIARAQVADRRFFLEDAEPALRDMLVAATDGETLGPVSSEEGVAVVRVLSKSLPADGDEAVVARAQAVVIGEAVKRELAQRVRWFDPL